MHNRRALVPALMPLALALILTIAYAPSLFEYALYRLEGITSWL